MKILRNKSLRYLALLSALIWSASCDQNNDQLAEENTSKESTASLSGTGSNSKQSGYEVSVAIQEKGQGLNLLAAVDSYNLKLKCDSGSWQNQSSNFTLDYGQNCQAYLEFFTIGSTIFSQSAGDITLYESSDSEPNLRVAANSSDATDFGANDPNSSAQKQIQGVVTLSYSYQQVRQSVEGDSSTADAFLDSLSGDVPVTVAGHAPADFKFTAWKDVNGSSSTDTGLTSLKILLEGSWPEGSSGTFYLGDPNSCDCSSSCGTVLTSAAKDAGDLWAGSNPWVQNGVDADSFSNGFELSVSASSDKYIHACSSKSGTWSRMSIFLDLVE